MKYIFLCLALLFTVPSFILAQAYEGSIEYDKKKQQAFVIEYPFGPEAVENAVIEKMEQLGYKAKEEKGLFNNDKGFRRYKNAYITEIDEKSHDYILKVERKSKRDSDRSLIYLIMMKDNVNSMNSMDAEGITRAKNFLNNLLPGVEASQLELDIKSQEDVVAKAEKKLKRLQDDKKDMEDKIRKLQDDIRTNERDQENTQKDIINQKLNLENLRNKRRA